MRDHQTKLWRLTETDWYSPRRLLSSPSNSIPPGDRFIPNRSLMNLDQAHGFLTSKNEEYNSSKSKDVYRQKLAENFTLDCEGREFRMLVFRGSQKSSRKSIDEIRKKDAEELAEELDINNKQCPRRDFTKKESRILDAPNLKDDFYMNIMDWGKNNILAVALGRVLYLWNSKNGEVQKLSQVVQVNDHPTSVSWSSDAQFLAAGYVGSKIQLWDAETSKLVRNLEGHHGRVATLSWNPWRGHMLTSGSSDKTIINHDVRVANNVTSRVKGHKEEVCGLKWSCEGSLLASGGNENRVYIWEPNKMSSSKFLYRFNEHRAAVKALAWCPYQFNILASGGGTKDGCIKLWNVQNGTCISSVETKAQISGLEWNRHHKEILSGHGFSSSGNDNKLCLWKYPSMTKMGELMPHKSRVLELSQSPDGVTVVSGGADETLRFWDVFGPPRVEDSNVSYLDGLLSLKTSPIR